MATPDGGQGGFRGSDGVLYKTTPEDPKAKALDIRTTERIVQAELDALYAAQLQNALLAIAGGLDSSADNYLGSEHSNLANLNNVSLPKANLS
ncbi:hypothetical protein [Streptomyces sp. NPDC059402]|jgi:hypothetical protein|uniref:hypothetical protein n=1 Tax=Streptomyces sp. NPDC059402 TaxID=3346822 RepID=UPI00367EE416